MNKRSTQRARRGRSGIEMKSLGRLVRYLTRFPRQAALPYLFLVVASLSQLAVPRMVRNIIDAVSSGVIAQSALSNLARVPAAILPIALPKILAALGLPAGWTLDQLMAEMTQRNADAPSALLTAALSIVGFAALRGVFSFLQVYWAERNSQNVAFELRNDLFAKIQRLSFSYHDRNQTGQLMIRATDDVEKVRIFIGQGVVQLVSAVVLIVGTLLILFTTNLRLAFVTLPILPIAMVMFVIFAGLSQPLFSRVQARLSALNTTLQENLAGIRVVKAFAREREEQAKFQDQAGALMNQAIGVARLFTFLFPLVFFIANLGQAAILFFGGQQIIGGTLTLGEWQEFSLYLMYLFLPIAMFGMIITQMGQAAASAHRIVEILDAQSDVRDAPDARTLPAVEGRVQFERVTFRYFGGGAPVLKEVSFEALPGQTIALLGATGSGKTTIINLLPRFYDPSEGRITIDGHDLRSVTLESLRAQIGIVLQDTTLFTGTIRDNIAFGRPEASPAQVTAAARAAAAHDFISAFPQGYDTPVGERGVTLSGGQKQRIAIARALLLEPRILILDDSTSSVDMATESQIQQALNHLMRGRTSFVIAQRISTVVNADQILVLERGEIVARGTHAELMEESAVYAEIYNSQLVGEAPAGQGTLSPTAAPA
ncbi:MAG TPA: ABC transporter ATP-binding protein [Anaerolineales bacterium]|nr:ABC transporter ATP-binding protein [Anaerolineales bacterium]